MKGNTEQIIERTRSVKKYQERYPLDSYNHVITEKNKDAIDCLNQLVDKLNQLVQDEVFNKDEFVSVYNEMRKINLWV